MSAEAAAVVAVRVDAGEGSDAEELDQLTGRLRRELLELDVDDVRRGSGGDAPEGARGVDVAAIGQLLVSLASAPAVLRGVASAIGAWVERSAQVGSVVVELDGEKLEVTGRLSDDQRKVVDLWIDRHAAAAGE
jgi:hypothetical protein